MRGLYGARSASAKAIVAAVGLLLLCVGRTEGYAFSTKGPTASNGVPAAGSPSTAMPGSQPVTAFTVQDNIDPDPNQNTNPITTAPIFSGFGHVTNVAATTDTSTPETQKPTPTATTAATFSGFGHAHGVSPVFPTMPQSSAPAPPPVFSGFGHALGLGANGANGVGSGTTAATIMPWGVVGSSMYDAKNNHNHEDDDDEDEEEETDGSTSSSMDPDLYQASKFLHEARDKVLQLRQELEQKANQQKELVQQLRSELKSQGVGYEERLERLAEQFQDYKFAVHRQKLELQDQMKVREEAIRAEAAVRERVLQTELASVQTELALVRDELAVSQQWNQTMTEEFAALQANFTELRQIYMDDEMEWEDRLEMEQNDRRRDRLLAERVLKEAQEEAADKIRRARMDGTVVVEAVKSDFNNRLWQKETQLQKTSIELKRTVMDKNGLEERLEELEAEREDLGALTKQTAKVVKEVAKHTATNTLQKAKNFFRRNKLG